MKLVFGLDPGTRESALVVYNGTTIQFHNIVDNEMMLGWLRTTQNGGIS